MARAVFRVGLSCDNACVFCAQAGLDGEGHARGSLAPLREASDEVTFVGGEPLLATDLPELVAQARALGFRKVGVQTNGRGLAKTEVVDALARAGLTDVHVSLHGAAAAVHDYHTGVAGSFDAAIAGARAARDRGLDVVVATVLTRSSFRVLAPIPRLVATLGARAWLIEVAHAAGRAAAQQDRTLPRLSLALPFALHALDVASKLGLAAWIRGAPACLLGPFAARALPDAPRSYAEACDSCDARPSCAGVDAAYLARFAGDELSRRDRVALDERDAELARMFVGVGPLARAPAGVAEAAVAPSRARVALPMLGKVVPARAEAPRRAELRTGDALRAILPTLFDEE